MRTRWMGIPLLITGLLLAGCTATGAPPAPDPTPTTPAVAEPVSVRPDARIPLTCDEVPLPEVVGAFTGVTLAPVAEPLDRLEAAWEEQAGTLRCRWEYSTIVSTPEQTVVLPEDVHVLVSFTVERGADLRMVGTVSGDGFDPRLPESSSVACNPTPPGQSNCLASAVVGDDLVQVFVSGAAPAIDPDLNAQRAMVADGIVPALDLLASRAHADRWSPSTGGWPAPLDCAALPAEAVAGAMGASTAPLRQPGEGNFREISTAEIAALGGRTTCLWAPDRDMSRIIRADLLSGGAWYRELPAAPPTPMDSTQTIEVVGADLAEFSCDGMHCWIEGTIGVNAFRVTGGTDGLPFSGTRDQLIAAAAAIVAALAAA